MPVEFIVKEQDGYYECRYIGAIADQEHLNKWQEFYDSGNWNPGFLEFMNLSALGAAEFTPSGLQKVAEYRRKIHRQIGIRQSYLVLAPTSLGFGISRMYLTYCDATPEDAVYVYSIEDAHNFLANYAANAAQVKKSG